MPKDSRTRRERMREAKRRARAAESEEARSARMARDRARQRRARDEETPEVRAARLEQARRRQRQRRKRVREEKERQARDALCHALLEQVQHDPHECDDDDLFLEKLHGDYSQTLRKTPQPPDAIMLFLNQNFLRQARQKNSELEKAGVDIQDLAMLGFTPGMCIEDVQQLLKSQEEVSLEQPNSSTSLDQDDPGPQHIKEEEEEFWPSQEGEQFQRLEEADTNSFTSTPVPVKLIKRNFSPHNFSKDKLNG